MAGRRPNILQEIQSVLNKAAIVYQNRIKFQAPVDTGRLKASVKVQAFIDADFDAIRFEVGYLRYGRFTDLGTGPYYKGENERAKWNKSPRKGKGGIRPRYWTNIDQQEKTRILNILYPEIAKKIQEYWNTIMFT
jgi:hypothetical protein